MPATDLMAAAVAALADTWGPVRLLPVAELGGSTRSDVWRVRVRAQRALPNAPRTLVVKRYNGDNPAPWAREVSGLEAADDPAIAPRIHGTLSDPKVVVLEDLGKASSVADALSGRSPSNAARAVYAWTDTMARLHVRTRDRGAEFAERLGSRAPHAPAHAVPAMLDTAATTLEGQLGSLGLTPPSGSLDLLRGLGETLGTNGRAALSPADACPDNNVRRRHGLALIDFEASEYRHIAWDIAYLLVPWPSCWSSWRLPDRVATAAFERYRRHVSRALPYVGTDEFMHDVRLAVLGWTIATTPWFLPRALAGGTQLSVRPAPSRRAMILHRLSLSTRLGGPGPLIKLAYVLEQDLRRRWGDEPLALAPAFWGHATR
ncbi:phosphotransferase [Solicola gregarius]|uniref:Phosphotransferase n=1 Tax=Solicola gregarius TaxID=2908642 RepID=A0AA46TF95_9ACTN|nr:phosphotransferase [Solicola gregarius]UYM04165.1 phosphotransferase [Solicola gregarius]